MFLRLMKPSWSEVLRNVPDEGSGGAAADAGGAADTGAGDGAGTEEVSSVLGRTPAGEKPTDAASSDGTSKDAGDDGKATETPEGEGQEADPKDVVPEDGVYSYTLPEGLTADPGVSEAMNPVFKEAGLTQKQVDLVVGKYADLIQKDQLARTAKVDETLTGWLDTAKKDPEIGGDNWDASVKNANAVLDRFGDDEIDAALRQTGAGVHPSIIRLLSRVGKAIADDTFVAGRSADPEKRSFEDSYAKTTPEGKRT